MSSILYVSGCVFKTSLTLNSSLFQLEVYPLEKRLRLSAFLT